MVRSLYNVAFLSRNTDSALCRRHSLSNSPCAQPPLLNSYNFWLNSRHSRRRLLNLDDLYNFSYPNSGTQIIFFSKWKWVYTFVLKHRIFNFFSLIVQLNYKLFLFLSVFILSQHFPKQELCFICYLLVKSYTVATLLQEIFSLNPLLSFRTQIYPSSGPPAYLYLTLPPHYPFFTTLLC